MVKPGELNKCRENRKGARKKGGESLRVQASAGVEEGATDEGSPCSGGRAGNLTAVNFGKAKSAGRGISAPTTRKKEDAYVRKGGGSILIK